MKNLKETFINNKKYIIFTIIIGLLFHLPIFIKDILTADIILNNNYYSGYSWEISLGRFGLFIIGLLRNYFLIPQVELFLSLILVGISSILLIDLFNIKNRYTKLLLCCSLIICPNISTTLLFNYCSFPYTLALTSSILAIYILLKEKNKYLKYLIPIILIVTSISMYQAYLQVSVTLLILYYIKLLLSNKLDLIKVLKQVLTIIISIIIYFILMKLIQLVLNIDMSTYNNANSFGLSTIINMPLHILTTYKTFYDYYFTNNILNNTYLYNNILNFLVLIIFLINVIYLSIKNNLSIKNKLILFFLIITLPIYFNCILLITPSAKMQLLMSSSYILLIPLILDLTSKTKISKIIIIILLLLLVKNNLTQSNATYQILNQTSEKTKLIVTDIVNKINEYGYDKQVMIINTLENNKYYNNNYNEKLHNLSYGYLTKYSLFWNDYMNFKHGFTRYLENYLGTTINYVDQKTYNEILTSYKNNYSYPHKNSIELYNDIIIITL